MLLVGAVRLSFVGVIGCCSTACVFVRAWFCSASWAKRLEQLYAALQQDPKVNKKVGISAKEWIKRYQQIQRDRLDSGEISSETFKNKSGHARLFAEKFGSRGIKDIETKDIVAIIDAYKAEGKLSMAHVLRATWKDIYKEAQYAGEVDSGYNPPEHVRNIRLKAQRQRITEHDIIAIMKTRTYMKNSNLRAAIKLAITTGLRISDIASLKFSDVKDGYLFVATQKSRGKTKLAFPLTLTNPFLNESLDAIIKECRSSRIVTQYLIHGKNGEKKGKKLNRIYLSELFRQAKMRCEPQVSESTFSFHELRSFAERTYRSEGYDTKTLLGHKSQEMTDRYNDDRQERYTYISAPK